MDYLEKSDSDGGVLKNSVHKSTSFVDNFAILLRGGTRTREGTFLPHNMNYVLLTYMLLLALSTLNITNTSATWQV